MKPDVRPAPDPATARDHLWTNLLVLPGLGSVLAGRRIGYLQIMLSASGMMLSLWFAAGFVRECWTARALVIPEGKMLVAGVLGVVCFGGAWLWSLVTSVSVMRTAPRQRPR